jgi:hypothetical protein
MRARRFVIRLFILYLASISQSRFIGYHSRITRFPDDGAGVAILTNDDAFGPVMKEIIKYRLADEIFGLQPVDWDSR